MQFLVLHVFNEIKILCCYQTEVECTASPANLTISSICQRGAKSTASNVATASTSQAQNESKVHSNDIGEWPSNFNRDYKIEKGNMNSEFLTEIFCLKSFFTYAHKSTNKTDVRYRLYYSETKRQLFCFVCKVMDSGCSSWFTKEGFDD